MLKLSDQRGKWVVLFSHPADFTPVCSTEFMAFARNYDEFTKRNAVLIGISVDSVYSHIAWIRNIEEKGGVKVPFPVVADLDMKVAQQLGCDGPPGRDRHRADRLLHRRQGHRAGDDLLSDELWPQHR